MRIHKAKRSRNLLLFFVIIEVVAAGFGLYYGSSVLWDGMGRNLSIRLYNRVLTLCLPGYLKLQNSENGSVYFDLTATMYPAVAANELMLWYESQAESQAGYENRTAAENSNVRQMIEENQKTAGDSDAAASDFDTLNSGSGAGEEDITGGGENSGGKSTAGKNGADEAPDLSAAADGEKAKVNRRKLKDFDYLLQNFYQVDNTTTISSKLLNAEKLLAYDMTIDTQTDGPQILIYHTHSQEGFKDSVAGDPSTTVVGIGDRLTELLEARGYRVLHNKGVYDKPRDRAYSTAAPYIEQILADNPSIQVVIDLHRDGVSEDVHLLTEQDGKKMAKIMFFNGLSHTTAAGDIPYLKNPYIEENLAFSLQMQLAAAESYPDLTRKIYLKGYRFNMHFCPKTLLVEAGAQTNTVEEVLNAMEPLADILDQVIGGTAKYF